MEFKALGILFGHLPYPLLCTCATVSKTWRKTALDELQSRCTATVNNNAQISLVLQKFKESSTFKVGKCIITSPFTDNLLAQQLLIRVATTLNVLKIESTDIQEAFLFRIVANLPNLTQLSVVLLQVSSKTRNQDDDDKHHCCNNFNFPFLSGPLTNPFSSSYESNKCVSKRISDESQPNRCTGNSCKDNESGTGTSLNKENESFVHHSIRHLHFDIGQSGRLQMSKIFHTFPNLVELNVSNIVDEPRKNFKYQQQPDSSRHIKCTLKYLSIRQYSNIGYSEKLVQTLMKLGMRLAKLVLIFPPPSLPSHKSLQVCSAPLKQFVEMQGSTLKSLKLIQVEDDLCSYNYCEWDKNIRVTSITENITSKSGGDAKAVSREQVESKYWWNFNYSSPSFPLLPIHLPNLEVLHVQKPLITNLAQVLHHFPKLSMLSIHVSPNGAKWRSMFPQRLEPHVQISTFKLDFIDSDSLSRLGYCFPSLQTLQMSYCDESLFNTLCKLIPCFNGKAAKENLVPCDQCHEKSRQGKVSIIDLCLQSYMMAQMASLNMLKSKLMSNI